MATSPIIYKYPLDLTGMNPKNLVLNEPHQLPNGTNRAFVPNYGAFFARSLVIKDSSGNALTPKVQYKAVQLYQEATEKTGLEVMTVIVITDESIESNITVTYQAIGGEFTYSVTGLRDMVDSLDLDNRPVIWGEIIGTPDNFTPAPHLHDAGDLYGFEYLTESIDSLRRAVQGGNESVLEHILDEIQQVRTLALPKASNSEALDGVRDDVLLTPKTAKLAFDHWSNLPSGE